MVDDITKYISGKELMGTYGFNATEMHLLPLQRYKEVYKYGPTEPFQIPNEETWGLLSSNVVSRKVWGKIGVKIHPTKALPCEYDEFCKTLYKRSDIEKLKRERPETFNKHLPTNDNSNIQTPDKTPPAINVKGDVITINLDENTISNHFKIAIEAWTTLYQSGEYNQWKTGHLPKIKEWIKRNYPEVSPTAADRIARVVNLNPNGGAPHSTSN